MGFFGLSGVVVNDSLVMIDFIDQRLKEGAAPKTAIIDGAKGRFRPIQAQFLVPFAASLGVGIMITTAILILLVPAVMTTYLRANSHRRRTGTAEPARTPTSSGVEPSTGLA